MCMYNPAHPGEVLKELIIEPLGLTIIGVAQHLNVNCKALSKILNGKKAITPEMALRLEIAFHNPSADHWLRLQNAYDLWQIRNSGNELHVQSYALQVAA